MLKKLDRTKNNIISAFTLCKINSDLLFCFFFLICITANSQMDRIEDSLRHVIETTDNDTLKTRNWNMISQHNSNLGYYVLAEKAGFEALAVAKRMGYDKGIGRACYYIGISFSKRNKYDLAMEWYLKAIPMYEKAKDTSGVAWTVMLIGVVDYYLKNNEKAIANYKKALTLFEQAHNDLGRANCLVNLGSIYSETEQFDKAIEYCRQAYKLFGASNHGKAVATSLIANIYCDLYLKNDSLGNKDLADEYLKRAIRTYNDNLQIYTQLDQPVEKSGIYLNLYSITFRSKKYNEAFQYLDSAFNLVKDVNNVIILQNIYHGYYKWYLQKSDSANALSYYLKYSAAKDSVFNMEKAKKIDALNVQLVEVEKEKEITGLKKDKEKRGLILWGVGLLAVLALALSILFFKRFREKQNANLVLSDKNKIIEDKNKEIIDSINYAKRIQQALLTSESELQKCFTDVFVLYKPKDIVSGDFYWYAESEQNKILAVADCTGHGVPGAFMSMMGYEMLQDILLKENITTTAEALKILDVRITETLNKSAKSRDGMDMALCAFSKSKQSVQFSGANRPLLHFSNGILTEYKPNKNTIGGDVDGTDKKYHAQDIAVKQGDIFYFFTDGYADQFGGSGGKKFKYKQLKEILQTIYADPLEVQKQKLEAAFETWKGNLEQVDDICVIGVKI